MSPIPKLILLQIGIYIVSLLPFLSNVYIHRGQINLRKSEHYKNCIIILGILFCVFASYDGDWYHYYDVVKDNYYLVNPFTHIEYVHLWIIKYLTFGYYIWWRFIVWGLTFYFIKLSFKKLGNDDLIGWSCFLCICLLQMSTGRVYLGLSILFYGFVLLITSRKRLLSIVNGLILMGVSIFFHKSMFIFLILCLLSLIHLKKWQIFGILLCLPIIVSIFKSQVTLYMLAGEANDAASRYLNDEVATQGIGIILYSYTFRALCVVIYLISTLYIYKIKHNYYDIESIWQYVFNIFMVYIIVYCALTMNNIGSASISYRMLNALYFPLAVLYSYLIRMNYKKKYLLIIFVFLFCSSVYRLIYAYYVQSLGRGV